MDQERLSLLALHFVPGIGDFLLKQLVSYCGSAEAVFRVPKGKLMSIPGVGQATASAIKNGDTFRLAELEFDKAEKENTAILFLTDSAFPVRLKQFDDCPSVLYFKGNVNLNSPKTVGIVGTRQASEYGRRMVEMIIEGLVPHRALVISGLAYGIDIHAHKQALSRNLRTIGVMGSGINVVYPGAHREVARRMVDNGGGLASELPFGAKPDAHNFPARNRIIAALSDVLIVVEAAEKGGALITAEIANSYNKDVFAVPGAVGETYSEGCNKLIKTNKAHLLTSVKDVEYIMNWSADDSGREGESTVVDWTGFDPEEQKVLSVLKENESPMMIDELSRRTDMGPGMLASLLLGLEFKNAVNALPGKMYRISGR